jgi:hypothetical protein
MQKAGYFPNGLAKIAAAKNISEKMTPERNRSKSFQIFRQGLLDMVG